MAYCSTKDCRANAKTLNKTKGGISFFNFPRESKIKEQWIAAANRGDDWFPKKRSVVCSQHFTEDDFIFKKSGRRHLKQGAIPLKCHMRFCSVKENEASNGGTSAVNLCSSESTHYETITGDLNPQQENPTNPEAPTLSIKEIKLMEIIRAKDDRILRQTKNIKRIQDQMRQLKKKLLTVQNELADIKKTCSIKKDNKEILHETVKTCSIKIENNEMHQETVYVPALSETPTLTIKVEHVEVKEEF